MDRAIIVQGMAWGDEGKGQVTDSMARLHNSPLVIRFSGGPQAAHNVLSLGGIHHTFSQFCSGTLAGARTHLGPKMLINPDNLEREAEVLAGKGIKHPLSLVTIDPECVVILPEHVKRNRELETKRGANRHGSVGMGIGEARRDELEGKAVRAKDLPELARFLRDTQEVLAETRGTVIFEGNQGVLLDEKWGSAPYNTWTDCTFRNALDILKKAGVGEVEKVGVIRSYLTRHGPGPFPTEDKNLCIPEEHNREHPWMGKFRQGWLDSDLLCYAVAVARPDVLCMTHMDRVKPGWRVGTTGWDGEKIYVNQEDLTRFVEWATECQVKYQGWGPSAASFRTIAAGQKGNRNEGSRKIVAATEQI